MKTYEVFFHEDEMMGYEITERPAELGGGWKVSIYDEFGEEIAGTVFPVSDECLTEDLAYQEALDWALATAEILLP